MSEQDAKLEIGAMRAPNETFYPIEFVPDSPLNEDQPNYTIRAIKFLPRSDAPNAGGQTENVSELVDGALFNIKPGKPSDAERITEPGYTAVRQCVEGNGVGLILRADGTVDEYNLSMDADGRDPIELHQGDVDVWIAGAEGLKVLDRSTPPFKLEYEESVKLTDSQQTATMPPEYIERYHQLIQQFG